MKWVPVKLAQIAAVTKHIIRPNTPEAEARPYLGLEQIESNTGRIVSKQASIGEGRSTCFAFDQQHVLYGKLRPYLNKVALPDYQGRCSTEIIPLFPIGVDREFLAFLLKTEKVVEAAMSDKTGSRMPRADMGKLLRIKIVIPEEIEEQRRIAERLNAQLATVEAAKAAIANTRSEGEQLWKKLYNTAFHNIIPVAVPPHFPEPPCGWKWSKLNEIARLESGHTPSRNRSDWWGGDVSWISLTEIRELDGGWTQETQIKTNADGIRNSAARILPIGTVCYSRTASVGFVTIMAEPMATSQDFANWVCGNDIDPEFLMHALICSRQALRSLATGATHKTIYMPTLESFHLCAPTTVELQKLIAKNLNSQLAKMRTINTAVQKATEELETLPPRILATAFGN
jgi:type I restriction enzyme S subunit